MLPTLTIDVGTTSIKLMLFDADGTARSVSRLATPTRADAVGTVYDLEAIVGALAEFLGELEPARRRAIQRIAITGVGESGGLVREDLSLASPQILWHDQRGAAQIAALDADQRRTLYRVTGLPANANYGLSKTAWALRQGEDTAGALWLNVAEYLSALLTGRRAAEYSLASRTMALDLRSRSWSAEVCALFDVDPAVLPPLHAAADGAPVTAEAALRFGLAAETVVHVAGHDHMVGGVGAGLVPGELLNSTGTTEGLLFLDEQPTLDDRAQAAKLANGIASTADAYTVFASIPSGGAVFAALQSLLGLDASRLSSGIEDLYAAYLGDRIDLAAIPVVLPQFRGSAPPAKDAAARAAIAGLGVDTTPEQIVFGCFLGMALQFQQVLDLFGREPSRIKVIGPASRNPLWLQLKSDLLAAPLSVSRFPEVVSRGAQSLASDVRPAWVDSDPFLVAPDEVRGARLAQWRERTAAQRAHLAGVPS